LWGDRSGLPPIEPAARQGRLPLSFAQERERALGEIVRRHEALRRVFAEADGSPVW